MERHDRGAPRAGARRHPGHHRGAGGRARTAVGDDVADRQETGIGRATLYKYFPDVEAILLAWHHRQVAGHLEELAGARDQVGGDAGTRLQAVLEAYARISHQFHRHRGTELAAFLHRDDQVAGAERQLRDMIHALLTEGAATGVFRDVAPEELTSFVLHALSAAGTLPSGAAVRRLVVVILAGLRPEHGPAG